MRIVVKDTTGDHHQIVEADNLIFKITEVDGEKWITMIFEGKLSEELPSISPRKFLTAIFKTNCQGIGTDRYDGYETQYERLADTMDPEHFIRHTYLNGVIIFTNDLLRKSVTGADRKDLSFFSNWYDHRRLSDIDSIIREAKKTYEEMKRKTEESAES